MTKPLSAEDAETLIWMLSGFRNVIRGDKTQPDIRSAPLEALRDKRTVCIPVRSEEELREMFQSVIGAPPYEHMCDRGGPESAWPGQYKRYETQLAWETWLACARAIQGGV